jgi:hypothetical protein
LWSGYEFAAHRVNRLLDDLNRMSGVESAGAVTGVPLSGNIPSMPIHIEGEPDTNAPVPGIPPASTGYFRLPFQMRSTSNVGSGGKTRWQDDPRTLGSTRRP